MRLLPNRVALRAASLLVVCLAPALPAAAQYAIATDITNNAITLIDTNTDRVVAFKRLPGPLSVGCAISQDATTAYVSTFLGGILQIDLPGLRVRNTIATSTFEEEIIIDAASDMLLAVDGGGAFPISVVDLRRGREVFTFPGTGYGGIAQQGGYLLAAASDFGAGNVQLLRWQPGNRFGMIVDTGAALDIPGGFGQNPGFAPGGKAGAVIDHYATRVLTFSVPRMDVASSFTPRGAGFGLKSIEFHESGEIVFVRSQRSVWGYAFDPTTGRVGKLLWKKNIKPDIDPFVYYGLDQMLPMGDRLYVTEPNSKGIRVLDAWTGRTIRRIRSHQLGGEQVDLCGPAR